jgi:anti-sigma B factor antagonist
MSTLNPAVDAFRTHQFTINVHETGTTGTIELSGELDLAQRDDVLSCVLALLCSAPEVLVVDLTDVTFLDSTGLFVISEAARRSARQGTRLVIVPGPPSVQRIVTLCQLDARLPFGDA